MKDLNDAFIFSVFLHIVLFVLLLITNNICII